MAENESEINTKLDRLKDDFEKFKNLISRHEEGLYETVDDLKHWKKGQENFSKNDLLEIRTKLNENIKRIDSNITEITKNNEEINSLKTSFHKDIRPDIVKVASFYKHWKTFLLSFLGITGLSGLVIINSITDYFSNRISDTKQEIELIFTQIIEESSIEARVQKAFNESFLKQTEESAAHEFQNRLLAIQQNLANVRRKSHRNGISKPFFIEEINFILQQVIRRHDEYNQGIKKDNNSKIDRLKMREAFTLIAFGIEYLVEQDFDKALNMFNLAKSKTPALLEPYLFSARLYLEKGENDKANDTLRDAKTLKITKQETKLGLYELNAAKLIIDGDYDNAEKLLIALKGGYITYGEPYPASLDLKLGALHWSRCATTSKEKVKSENQQKEIKRDRENAIKFMEQAFTKDRNYWKAINNYIWYETHDCSDKILKISDNNKINKLRFTLSEYRKIPLISSFENSLNTITEAYVSITPYDEAKNLKTTERNNTICGNKNAILFAKMYASKGVAEVIKDRDIAIKKAYNGQNICNT